MIFLYSYLGTASVAARLGSWIAYLNEWLTESRRVPGGILQGSVIKMQPPREGELIASFACCGS